jgi:hypothetical protein
VIKAWELLKRLVAQQQGGKHMSFMTIQPDMQAAAASDLSVISSAISADNAAVQSMLVSTPSASAGSYAATEAANAITVR